mgnify:CR=1 FL=1
MSNVSLAKLLRDFSQHRCVFENRPTKYKFGTLNYGEIPGTLNSADGDPWDVFAPGYSYSLRTGKEYKPIGILGIFYLSNGNHKIAVRLSIPGFDKIKAMNEIKRYCKRYSEYTKICGVFVPHHKQRNRLM